MKKILSYFTFCKTEVPVPEENSDLEFPYLSDDSEPIYHPFPTRISTLTREKIENENEFKPTIVIEDARGNKVPKTPNRKVFFSFFCVFWTLNFSVFHKFYYEKLSLKSIFYIIL